MNRFALCALCFLMGLVHCTTYFSAEVTVFGPNEYWRTKGSPNLYEDAFSASPGLGTLIICNGDDDRKKRVSSASVCLNGEEIFIKVNKNSNDTV